MGLGMVEFFRIWYVFVSHRGPACYVVLVMSGGGEYLYRWKSVFFFKIYSAFLLPSI